MQSYNNNIIADAFQAVEVKLPGVGSGQTQQQFNFPDLPYLRPNMAYIQAIEVYTLASVTNSPISGTALVSLPIMQKTALTIYGGVPDVKQGNEIIQRMPILRLNNLRNSATDPYAQQIMKFRDLQIDWTKTMLTIANSPGNITDMAFVFGVYFNFAPGSLMNQF